MCCFTGRGVYFNILKMCILCVPSVLCVLVLRIIDLTEFGRENDSVYIKVSYLDLVSFANVPLVK